MSYEYEPPSWQKDAIPTEVGWRHSQTGELLVSVPGGVKMTSGIAIHSLAPGDVYIPMDEIPVLTNVVNEKLEATPEVVVPVKRGRGRPKKNV